MNLEERIALLSRLGRYLDENGPEWQAAKEKAYAENGWFIPEFIDLAVSHITSEFLPEEKLRQLAAEYQLDQIQSTPRKVGLVMAGNIPLVGFHDLVCIFLSGHSAMIKASSKDEALIKSILKTLLEWEPETESYFQLSTLIRHCDAYIATGSNNSSRYFDYYFGKYPSIIRKNRTSVAILEGNESPEQLSALADDVYLFFGLGCRNVTQIHVPPQYDFIPLLEAFRKYHHLINHHKYKNNYDYHLAMHILNNQYYMTNGSILLVENATPFSPISQLHYQFYSDEASLREKLEQDPDIQAIVSSHHTPFGQAQFPGICEYADKVDTMKFLNQLP